MVLAILTKEDAQKIIEKDDCEYSVTDLKEVVNNGYSHTVTNKTYIADLADSELANAPPTHSTYITIFESIDDTPIYHNNSLETTAYIIFLIRQNTSIPISDPHVDSSGTIVPFPYLTTPIESVTSNMLISLADLRRQGVLTPQQQVLIDLQIGQFLGQLHSGVQNDWFGFPSSKPPLDPSYSWQESFTAIFDAALSRIQAQNYDLPYADIHAAMSRAIAFFLFDDVEVPSLIWLTGFDDDIYLTAQPTPTIAAILPNLAHAVWGDPLLESFFLPPCTEALLEGYKEGGGEALTVFPRQKTKRLWYTLFLALVVLLERGQDGSKGKWAIDTIAATVTELKTAPCF